MKILVGAVSVNGGKISAGTRKGLAYRCPMQDLSLPYLEVGAAREEAELAIILMHGLGADAHDFEDVAGALSLAAAPRKWRFVLPNAPTLPVTINMGMQMPAWYDILDLSQPRSVNWETVDDSALAIEAFVAAESAPRIVLAGFSQGAAMALHVGLRHQDKIAGVLMMSGYLLESQHHPCPRRASPSAGDEDFPIGVFHGAEDSMVPAAAAGQATKSLQAAGFSPELKMYPGLEHSVSEEEVRDVFAWLCGVDAKS